VARFRVDFEMPHKHCPSSKHSRKKKARLKLLQELWSMPKVYDHEKGECIAIDESEHLIRGEIIYGPKFQSPFFNRLERKGRRQRI